MKVFLTVMESAATEGLVRFCAGFLHCTVDKIKLLHTAHISNEYCILGTILCIFLDLFFVVKLSSHLYFIIWCFFLPHLRILWFLGPKLPDSSELFTLLEKQDGVLSLLLEELYLCKTEISSLQSIKQLYKQQEGESGASVRRQKDCCVHCGQVISFIFFSGVSV